jgi:hypothetical protein
MQLSFKIYEIQQAPEQCSVKNNPSEGLIWFY